MCGSAEIEKRRMSSANLMDCTVDVCEKTISRGPSLHFRCRLSLSIAFACLLFFSKVSTACNEDHPVIQRMRFGIEALPPPPPPRPFWQFLVVARYESRKIENCTTFAHALWRSSRRLKMSKEAPRIDLHRSNVIRVVGIAWFTAVELN